MLPNGWLGSLLNVRFGLFFRFDDLARFRSGDSLMQLIKPAPDPYTGPSDTGAR
jgi:hypothetical protein